MNQENKKERIILDTNTFIDGSIGDFSFPSRIIEECLQGNIQPVISHRIEKENKLIMSREQTNPEYQEWLESFFDRCEKIHTTTRTHDIPDDPEDEKFLECAIDGNVDYIITEDYHLLDLDPYNDTIQILKPSEYWSHYEAQDESGAAWADFAKSIGIGK